MTSTHNRAVRGAVILMAVVATACVSHSAGARRADDFDVRLRGIHRAAVLTSSVHAYEVSAGNSLTEEHETSLAAADALQEHAAQLLRAHKVAAIRIDPPLDAEADDTRALANIVGRTSSNSPTSSPSPAR
jgi:hypothetical protein